MFDINSDEFKTDNITHKCDTYSDLDTLLLNKKGLLILHTNIRSLNKNFDNLKLAIKTMKKCPDVIICTETYKIRLPALYEIDNYKLYYVDSQINKSDGTCIYIKSEMMLTNSVVDIGRIKALLTEIKFGNEKIIITSLYRSHCVAIRDFISDLKSHLHQFKAEKNHFIIGDINIDILRENPKSNEYLSSLYEYGFQSYINIPTRFTDNQSSCIDHIIGKNDITSRVIPIVFDMNITDHLSTLLFIEHDNITIENDSLRYEKINFQKMLNEMSNETWLSVYSETNINNSVDKFITTINFYINAATSFVKRRKQCKPRKDWITRELINSCKIKEKMYNQVKRNPNNVNLKNRYVQYKNKLKQSISEAKKNHNDNLIEKIGNDSRKLWDFINTKINGKSRNDTSMGKIQSNENDQVFQNEVDIANEFNTFFAKVGLNMAEKFERNSINDICTNVKENSSSMFFEPLTEQETLDIIMKMKNGKASGIDKITIKIVKMIGHLIAKPLTHILNNCIENAIFPDHFKKAEILPIFKAGNKELTTNYRPISLISNFAKVFEKAIKSRIVAFIGAFELINKYQFGFQKGKNTDDAITTVTNYIHTAISNKKPCIAIFLDLAKAFDTVNHDILLSKLNKTGFRGKAYDLIKSYLSDRKQLVKINETCSSEMRVECGVPQGTILGPILFILYINDMFNTLPLGDIVSFADDTVLMVRDETWDQVVLNAETKLHTVANWLYKNHLTLNSRKTVFLTFGSYKISIPINVELKVHATNCNYLNCNCDVIARVEKTKYLGVYIDSNLNWNEQVQIICKKTRYLIYLFYKIRNLLHKKHIVAIYYALFWSWATYGIIAWGGTHEKNIKQLELIQKKMLKIIFDKPILYPTEQLFQETEMIGIRKFYVEKSLFKHFVDLQTLYNEKIEKQARNLAINLPKVNKEIDRRNNIYIAYKTFNLLPQEYKQKTINSLREGKLIRRWLIGENSSTIREIFHPIK